MMTVNQGNILKIVHETGCDPKLAVEALKNSNSWPDTYKYVRENN